MEDDLYSIIEKKIKAAGSYDPIDVAEHFHIPVSRTTSSVIGFAFLYTPRTPVIGIHRDLDPMWYMFTGWHELGGHVFGGHVYEHTENGGLADVKLFTVDVDCRTIPRHEKEANLVSANVCVPDEDVLEAINYNNSAFQEFLDTKAEYDDMIKKLEQLKCTYSYQCIPKKTAKQMRDLRLEIQDYQEILHDLASDLYESGCIKTSVQIAGELGIDVRILRYKLEAMRQRGYEINPDELEKYNKMFDGIL